MDDPYERLKAEMPEIAKAVNAFTSEQVQQQAFRALIRSLAGVQVADESETPEEDVAEGGGEVEQKRPRRRRGKRAVTVKDPGAAPTRGAGRRKAAAVSLDNSLQLRPKDKESFADFATAKSPKTNFEKNLIAVYWLTRVAGLPAATVDQVYTCYKDRLWRVPANLRQDLASAAYQKAWIDTSRMESITVTVVGENYVEQDLPVKPKA